MIQSHQVQDGGVEVIDRRLIDRRLEAKLVALAVAETFLHACSSEKAGKSTWVVIAAGPVALQERHPAELSAPHDQGVVEEATPLHVLNERGSRLIHDLCLHGMGGLNVAMRVPIGDAVAAAGVAPIE